VVDIKVNGQIIKGIELVIFDRDGTLISLYHYWAQMIGKRAELIGLNFGLSKNEIDRLMYEMGIDTARGKIRAEGPVGLKKREVVMQAAVDYLDSFGKAMDTKSICVNAFKEVDAWSMSNLMDLVKPIDGLYELFADLGRGRCKTAIATTDMTERAKIVADHLKLPNNLDMIVGTDSVQHGKPAPDMVDLITNKLQVDKTKTVMVGDAETDIKMGVNAGVRASIAVCSGIALRERLQGLTTFVADDIGGIKILQKDG